MTDKTFSLRGGQTGPIVKGTPSNVLTFQSGGEGVAGEPGGGGGTITSVFGRPGPAIIAQPGDYTSDQITNESTVPGLTDTDALNALKAAAATAQTTATAAQQPFKAVFYVDPDFAGTHTGSASNPFPTVAAAFAAAAALALANIVVYLPPGATITENIVFPPAGGSVDLTALEEFGTFSTTLTGTVTLSNSGAAAGGLTEFSLNNLDIENTVSGVFSGAGGTQSICRLSNTFVNAAVTLTTTGAGGKWLCEVLSEGFRGGGGEDGIVGALAVTGSLIGQGALFSSTLAFSDFSRLDQCTMTVGGVSSHAAGLIGLVLTNCIFNSAAAFTVASGSLSVTLDGFTAGGLIVVGATAGAGVRLNIRNANSGFVDTPVVGNVGPAVIAQPYPQCLMTAVCEVTILTPGTLGASCGVNIIYTDLTNTLVTVPLTPLFDITSPRGTKITGNLPFAQSGASPISFSVTGVGVAGPLAMAVSLSVNQQS